MPNRRLKTMNIREVLRLGQTGATDVEVARLLGCHRMTVAKYGKWAEAEGLSTGELPDEATLAALATSAAASSTSAALGMLTM